MLHSTAWKNMEGPHKALSSPGQGHGESAAPVTVPGEEEETLGREEGDGSPQHGCALPNLTVSPQHPPSPPS